MPSDGGGGGWYRLILKQARDYSTVAWQLRPSWNGCRGGRSGSGRGPASLEVLKCLHELIFKTFEALAFNQLVSEVCLGRAEVIQHGRLEIMDVGKREVVKDASRTCEDGDALIDRRVGVVLTLLEQFNH